MVDYDLTTRVGPYLDRHLVIPFLEFRTDKGIYDENDLLEKKLDLLANTNMVDFAMDAYGKLKKNDPERLKLWLDKRSEIISIIKNYKSELEAIGEILNMPDVANQIQSYRDSKQLVNYLTETHGFTASMIDTLYYFAKFHYECGDYSSAAEYLFFLRFLMPSTDKNYLNCLWGKLAAEILMQNWDAALDDFNRLKDYIESNSFGSALQSLQQRTWLLHWSLFVFFNHEKGTDLLIDMFLFQHPYLNAIQTICPHLLRYLATAVITNKIRRSALKELLKVIQQESYTYRDPITEFLEHLYVNFDFDEAQQKLRQCEIVLQQDFFLVGLVNEFIENARLMIFETFCRIHQCISISMLADKLNMDPDDAEHWIVDLIRNAQLNAKIDSKLGHVVMGAQTISPYHQLIEKTKTLTFRTQALAEAVEKRLTARASETTF
ncbi:Eukaryotic translation initiation factor 3 subunit E [Chamberlinius hualienensis]